VDIDWLRIVERITVVLVGSCVCSAILYVLGRVIGGGARIEVGAKKAIYILRYSRQTRAAIFLAGFMGPIAGGYCIHNGMADRRNSELAIASIIAGVFLAMSMPLATVAIMRHRIVITKDGLSQHGMSRLHPLKIVWGEISSITYTELGGGRYILLTPDGRKMYVERDLDGFSFFIQACYQMLAPAVFEKAFKDSGVPPPKEKPA
jgi:hypothetical protein